MKEKSADAWKVAIPREGMTVMRVLTMLLLVGTIIGSLFYFGNLVIPEGEPDRTGEPDLYGAIKAVDLARGTITLSIEGQIDEEQEKTYEVAEDARVLLEEPGKLTDLMAGSRVGIVLETACNRVVEIRTEPFRILVKPKNNRVEVNKPFAVELRVVNVTPLPRSFHVMLCSWDQHWKSSNRRITWDSRNCYLNFPIPIKLEPGAAYEKNLPMRASIAGALAFRMSFTPLEVNNDGFPWRAGKRTYWSSEATIEVNERS